MAVNTSAGSKIFIGTTASDPDTDTYTEVGEVTNIPEFGRVYSEIKYTALGNRDVIKFKGERDDGTVALDLGRWAGDAGQAAARIALDDDNAYNFKVTLSDQSDVTGALPTTFHFQARVMSYTTNIGTVSNVVMSKMTLGIVSGTIVEVEAT